MTIPKFTEKHTDPGPWGHEVQRVGHEDWLDKHVDEVRVIRSHVPPKATKEDRKAIADS